MMIVENENNKSIENYLKLVLEVFIRETGTHNGGDCATIAKYIGDLLEECDYNYSFSGEIINDGLSHILVKFNNKYYDGVEGEVNISNKNIVDNLIDDGGCIGNDKYGWVDYNLVNYKTTDTYKLFNRLSDTLA